MHPNPVFRKADTARNIGLARDLGFGILAVATPDAPLIADIPFLLSEDGGLAEFHLVRSNPIVRLLDTSQCARLAVQGPHSYVPPGCGPPIIWILTGRGRIRRIWRA